MNNDADTLSLWPETEEFIASMFEALCDKLLHDYEGAAMCLAVHVVSAKDPGKLQPIVNWRVFRKEDAVLKSPIELFQKGNKYVTEAQAVSMTLKENLEMEDGILYLRTSLYQHVVVPQHWREQMFTTVTCMGHLGCD